MSVTSETYKVSYPGRGDTGPYPITFDVVLNDGGNATDIVVKLLDADGVETDITSVCTVTGMNVYTTASYSADYDVVLIRYPSLTQPYTFPYVTKFPSRTFESALDRLLFLVQRLALVADQSFKVPLSEPEPAREPSIVDRANKWRAFDSNGDPIAVEGAAGEYPVSDFMATVLEDADASAVFTTLGVSAFIKTLLDNANAAAARATIDAPDRALKENTILTTIGDLFLRGTTDPERLAAGVLDTYLKGQGAGVKPIYEKMALRDTGVKIGTANRGTSGAEVVEGVGFKPSVIIFIATDFTSTNKNSSWGFDDGSNPHLFYMYSNDTNRIITNAASIYIYRDAENKISGVVSALGGDGFTITWTVTGDCDCSYLYLCLP